MPDRKPIRLPRDAYERPQNVFHVVNRAAPNTAPFEDVGLRRAVWDALLRQHEDAAVRLWAAALLPDHLHLVLSAGATPVDRWLSAFKSFTTRLSWSHGRTGSLWQPRFWDRRLRDDAEFAAAVGYVLRNPEGADLGEDWAEVRSWVGYEA